MSENSQLLHSYVLGSCGSQLTEVGARRKCRLVALHVHLLGAFAALAALWGTPASAQSYTIYTEPKFIYNSSIPTPYRATLDEAWSDVQAAEDYCTIVPAGTTCYNVQNLHPDTTGPYGFMLDGVWYWNYFDGQTCSTPTGYPTVCNTVSDFSAIQTSYVCAPNFGAGYYDTSTQNHLLACARTIPAYSQQPAKFCMSCLGNPIYASTGQKSQVETDYAGASGLNFTRTYLSNNGYFASVLTQAFVDNSTPQGTVQQACTPGTWSVGSGSSLVTGSYCFPYVSVYPHVNGGVAQYQLHTDDGRSTQFTGPNNAVTQNADINERVTQISVSGVNEWQVKRDDDTIEIYNSAGSLIQKTLRGGKIFNYTYSTSSTPTNIAPYPGLLISQSDAFGHTLTWAYNSSGQMTLMTDPAGGTYQYSYDSNNNLIGLVYPDSSSKTYWYNESANTGGASLPNALTGVTDENSSRYATFQYLNSNGNTFAVNTQHAGGVDSYNFTYSAYWGSSPYRAVVVDPLGTSRTYQFGNELSYNVDSSQTQPAASGTGTVTQSETYDANGNPATRADYNGNVTHYVYDLTRNLETSRTEAYGTPQARTITTTWDPNWRQPDLITEPNRTTGFAYDSMGNVRTKTITDTATGTARTWTYTYDGYGRMLTAQGPRTDVNSTTTYSYYTCTTGYQCGQVQTITDALGHITTFNTFNAHGQPLTITDPNSVVTTLTYDARLRLTSRQIGTDTTGYTYYPTGLLETVTLPDSSTITYIYDAAHRLTKITDGAGNYISYTLDNMGNRTAESTYDPSSTLNRAHTRVINALNELYQDINSAGTAAVTTTLAYDNNGNVTSSAAPLSRNTADQYDALNRLIKITDPNSGVTQLGYDANDNLASVIDPRNLTTSYTHNGFGDVTQIVSPDTGTSTSTYDSGGNLKTATDARSALATYAYDAMNRVTQAAYADQTINFTYDAGANGVGRLTGASDTNHTLSWTYDTLGRVTGKGQKVGTVTKSVGYAYVNGDLTSLVTPSGQTIVYAYANHRITSITVNGTVLLSSATYDPFGPATGWTWGNSTASTRGFDKDGNPSQIVTAGVTNGYTVDYASRITGLSDSGVSSNSFTFGYDLLDRVTSGTSTGKTRGYTYDANSNRFTTTGTVAFTDAIAPTSNQLSSTSGSIARTYGYDTAGNTTSYTGDSFTFNKRGRMSQAIVNGSASNYVYNALGQLIHKSGNGGNTLLMYDEAGHILGEYSSTGVLVEETIWMGDTPIATIRPSGSTIVVYYVHTDHLGTPRKVTRPSDNGLMWRWDPDTFGSVAPNQNPSKLGTFVYNLRFPGQYSLNESGLFYNYFRDYDPQTGRYIESDPSGLHGGINTYVYVADDPTDFADPQGLAKTKTKGFWANCSPADDLVCDKECAPRGVKSCRRWYYISYSIIGGQVVPGYVPAPRPSCNCNTPCEDNPAACAVTAVAAGYLAYRCVRMIPSLFPPLWWTIPVNAAAP
jgi:RHS repeat-associated protein